MNEDKPVESTLGVAEQASPSAPLLERAGAQAAVLTQRTIDSVRDRSRRVREQALQTSERTIDYIRAEPVKSVLIAAAVGAALMALGQLMAGHARRRD
ncbi:MAG TPA: hypothetical protein VLI72_04705 [Methylibium sp.]|nr:hypothetical protein [Methylibium sp.]